MTVRRRQIGFALLALVLVIASGCAKPLPAGLTDPQVAAATENVLKALDSGDYQAFQHDFSDTMVKALPQANFDALRTKLQKASGNFVSLGAPVLSNNQGYAVYVFPAKYSNETVYVTITFQAGGQKIEGLFFNSAGLSKASQ